MDAPRLSCIGCIGSMDIKLAYGFEVHGYRVKTMTLHPADDLFRKFWNLSLIIFQFGYEHTIGFLLINL